MAIEQTMCTSFKAEVLLGVHDFRAATGDTFKIALYTSSASIGPSTTAYSSTDEVTGTGYSAGGVTLTKLGVDDSSFESGASLGVGYTSFADVVITNTNVIAAGALIYNTTPSANGIDGTPLTNPAVCVLDFGGDKTANGGTLTITFPVNAGDTAIIRIA
jgi:hypothetical protein